MKKENVIKIVIVTCCILAGLFFALSFSSNNDGFVTDISAASGGASVGNDSAGSDDENLVNTGEVCVYVCGAVENPGVYYLLEGSRVDDAIKAAGGFTTDADSESLNLALSVKDGEQIAVKTVSEAASEAASKAEASDGLININTASEAELTTLPGIGSTRAAAIISYRETNGPFAKKSDIMNVSGIKEASYEKIKDLIKVE